MGCGREKLTSVEVMLSRGRVLEVRPPGLTEGKGTAVRLAASGGAEGELGTRTSKADPGRGRGVRHQHTPRPREGRTDATSALPVPGPRGAPVPGAQAQSEATRPRGNGSG